MSTAPSPHIDLRFSDRDAGPTPWSDAAAVFRIAPSKVLAFAKEPHAQTSFRFTGR